MKQYFLYFFLLLAGFANAQVKHKNINLLMKNAPGVYDNKMTKDTSNNPFFKPQNILMCPVWKEDTTARWLYFGWFSPLDKETPLEHGFWRIYSPDGKELLLDWYLMPQKNKYVQEWRKDKPFDDMLPSEVMVPDYHFCSCTLEFKGTYFVLKSKQRCRFSGDPKLIQSPAAYQSMDVDFNLYLNKFTTGSTFYAKDDRVVIQQLHAYPAYKVSKKYKSF